MKQRGHALIELAASAAVMMSCLAGTFQFGYTFYVYDELVAAVGNGARYAASRPYDSEKGASAVRNLVIYGSTRPAPDAAPVVPGLTAENVQVTWVKNQQGEPTAVDVAVTNYTVNGLFGALTFNQRPMAEFPYIARESAP